MGHPVRTDYTGQMRTKRAFLTALCATAFGACAGSAGLPPVPSPAELPALEATVSADPGDVEAGLRLAAGYRDAGRSADGQALIAELLLVTPEDPGLLVMAGLLAEDAGEYERARIAYRTVLESGRGGALVEEVERRLEVVRRAELRAEVVGALAREGEVAQTDPDPATVGVFPFFYEGDDPNWAPLAYALPEMLSTDLAITGRLQVLDRIRIQALLNEMALGESGRVDEGTAARSGRLLGSGNIIQGRFRIDGGSRLGIDAAVVEVNRPGLDRVDPLSAEDVVDRLFAMEKQLALDLHAELGIELTPAERQRISERQTESVQALLEFGRGLAAEDEGDFVQARQHFSSAASIDPAFGAAAARAEMAARMAGFSTADVVSRFSDTARRLAAQRHAVSLLREAPVGVRERVLDRMGAKRRAILAEVLGQDRVGQAILLELIFRVPGGEE